MKNTLLIAVACLGISSVTLAAGNGVGCAGIIMGSAQHRNGAADVTFSATEVVDINLTVLFSQGLVNKLAGDHVLEVRIFTPKGNLYQSIAIPFSSDKGKNGQKKKIDGYPSPVPVQVLNDVTVNGNKHLGASVALPVAGTPILNNSLYGEWKAQAYVDDEPIACAQPATFTITQ